ncbi:MAG: COG4280 domain-containing protein [Acidimicrobiales bacterium]
MTATVTVHSSSVVLVVAVFLASAVEMVEALTIVLAVGVTRGYRAALSGAAAALVVLAVLVATLGPALVRYVPLGDLRLVVGGLLLVFGLQWLRKALLRAAGLKAKHDEDAIFDREVEALRASGGRAPRDRVGFVVAFKGVFLEGLEVVVIVLTLGSTSHDVGLAALAAGAAVVVVAASGLALARQLSSVPENAMKLGVGLMLVSFGTFWSGEGVGVRWPGSDLSIPLLVVCYGAVAWAATTALRRARSEEPAEAGAHANLATVAGAADPQEEGR